MKAPSAAIRETTVLAGFMNALSEVRSELRTDMAEERVVPMGGREPGTQSWWAGCSRRIR
jgi:hypothetical protein